MSFFKKIADVIKSPIGRIGREPAYDWYFALTCFSIGIIIVIVISAFNFFKLTADVVTSDTETQKSLRITKEKIEKVISDTNQNDLNASSIPMKLFEDPSER